MDVHAMRTGFLGTLILLVIVIIFAPPAQSSESVADEHAPLSHVFTRGQCQGEGDVWFTIAPADPSQLSHIFPLGLMTGAHVTPVDHQYYYWATHDVPPDAYPVVAPADGVVVQVDFMHDDYRIIMEHSCDVYTIWIHLEVLSGPLAHLHGTLRSNRHAFERIPVSAGDVIALDGGTPGFDFSVYDQRVVLPGFLRPESYRAEPWKIHTVDPFEYFVEPVRSQLLAKNVRQVDPLVCPVSEWC